MSLSQNRSTFLHDMHWPIFLEARKTAIFMPGSYWNLNLGDWFAGEGFARQKPSRPES
jgi:hypothetical protein